MAHHHPKQKPLNSICVRIIDNNSNLTRRYSQSKCLKIFYLSIFHPLWERKPQQQKKKQNCKIKLFTVSHWQQSDCLVHFFRFLC